MQTARPYERAKSLIESCDQCSISAEAAEEMLAFVRLSARASEFCELAAPVMLGRGGELEMIASLGRFSAALSEAGASALAKAGEEELADAFGDLTSKVAGALADVAERIADAERH